MSAYGAISRPSGAAPLQPRSYALPLGGYLTVVPVRRASELPEDCVAHLAGLFDSVIREGRTYPYEEEGGVASFEAYFLSHDLFVGVIDPEFDGRGEQPEPIGAAATPVAAAEDVGVERSSGVTVAALRAGRSWPQCIAGMYYVKPNYPGRSSHCCNAGFLVDPAHRGIKAGFTLGRSFLYYGPRLGYRCSVFNLVYVTNVASLAIWDRLGFTRAGLIPRAGRLKKADGQGEEYVDAVVYWKDLTEQGVSA